MVLPRIFRRKLVLTVCLIAAVIVFIGEHPVSTGPAQGTELIGPPSTAPVSRYLRIGTFNIDGGQGLDGSVDLARTARSLQRLDLIGLNEVHGFAFASPPNQAEALCSLLHLPFLYVPAERRWGHDSFGNAIFSDLPVKHWQRVVLPSLPFKAKRNYLLTEVDWHGVPLHLVTSHTDWKAGGEEQLKIVRDVFFNLPTPAILMGDLNTPASSPLLQEIRKTPGVEEAIGQVLDPIPGRVDWIFLRGLTTVDAGSVDLKASDHPAYWAVVKIPNPSTKKSQK